jgi:beta-phosphoglucomutase-like phosphatase (HAD superfamily)
MDGTLVETERLWFTAEQAAVARLGGSLPDDAAPSLLGLDTETLLERLGSGYGVDVAPAVLRDAIVREVGARLDDARACPGAGELVAAALARGVRCAVVSNSTAAVVEATLAPHPWAAPLTLRVAADAVRNPKPAPDLYVAALAHLGLEPADCVAVEDSPTGVRAALAAGVACLGVTPDDDLRAELAVITPHVVASLVEARRWLALDDVASDDGSAAHHS